MSSSNIHEDPEPLLKGDIEPDVPIRVVSPIKLAFVAFFLVSAGPFGTENTVKTGGPGLALLAFLTLPFLYAIPQCLMTAEMSTMMDQNGGYIIWVQRAFGDFGGWMNGYNNVFCNMIDISLYPVIFVEALSPYNFNLTTWELWLIKFGLILFVAAINIRGINMVAYALILFSVIIFVPFLVEFGMRVTHMRPKQWIYVPNSTYLSDHFGDFMSSVLWAYTGWDGLGSFAGEVKESSTTYPRGIALGLLLVTTAYVVPILVGLTVDPNITNWIGGAYYFVIADKISKWLGIAVTVAGMVSSAGKYNAAMMSASRAVWAMGNPPRKLPGIFGYSFSYYKTPLVAILFNSLTTSILCNFGFGLLIEVDTFLNCLTLLFEFGSFLFLKYKEPDTPRPFAVPGGKIGAWAITIPKVLIVGLTLAMAHVWTWCICLGLNLLFVWAYWLMLFAQGRLFSIKGKESKETKDNDNIQNPILSQNDDVIIN
eukprot:TRINITY_DN3541_c0_g2_i1.p1 TRINITY_DN3541_c0_g2~~TRINITY_DN3541_c0_g2_i1.p1  ORF type:complete len:482 (+),score=58.60 TRINITY_DN3541_c0_g2_i1:88-1533(+)